MDDFQPFLSHSGNYQHANRFKRHDELKWSVSQAQTPTASFSDVSTKVVQKVAEVEDVDPLELTPPLYEAIDPDALNQLFTTTPTDDRIELQVTFSYGGCKVTVCADGGVSVEE